MRPAGATAEVRRSNQQPGPSGRKIGCAVSLLTPVTHPHGAIAGKHAVRRAECVLLLRTAGANAHAGALRSLRHASSLPEAGIHD